MHSLGRCIVSFVAIILVILFPLPYLAQSHNENIDNLIDDYTKKLTDTVRDQGYLDQGMYDKYVGFLDASGDLYDIEIEDIHLVTGEEIGEVSHQDNFELEINNELYRDTCSDPLHLDWEKDNHKAISLDAGGYELSNVSESVVSLNTTSDDGRKALSLSSHIHSEDCNSHSHIPMYDSTDVSQVPVFIQYVKRPLTSTGWKEDRIYQVCCAICGDLIYEFLEKNYSTYGKFEGSITYYTKENGVKVEHKTDYSTAAAYDYSNYIFSTKNYLYQLLSNNGGTEERNERSFDFYWPSSYLPGCDTMGNKIDISFTGCASVGKHYNPDACFPVGHMGKVIVSAYETNSSDGSGYYLSLGTSLQCADCKNYLYHLTLYNTSDTSFLYRTGFQIQLNNYTPSGSVTFKHYYVATTEYGIYQGNQTYNMNSYRSKMNEVYNYYRDILTSLPRAYNETGYSSIFSFTTPVIDNPFSNIPTRDRIGDLSSIVWIPYQGCGYCSPIGTAYSCQNEKEYICDQVVTNITPISPTQTIKKGENIISTAIATYLDGHKEIVECTASGFDTNQIGDHEVTLTYSGLVDNAKTKGDKTTTISVRVIPKKILSGITVSPILQSIEKYSKPSFTVTANYDDGTYVELTPEQYSTSVLDTSILGLQKITFSYIESGITVMSSAEIMVSVLHRTCPRCHNTYDLSSDDIDPGCPFCKELIQGIRVIPERVEVEEGKPLPLQVEAIHNDGSTSTVYGWTSNYNPYKIGFQLVTVEYGGFATDIIVWVEEAKAICPICHTEYPAYEGECPVCARTVVSISASPSIVKVKQYEMIDLTVTAFYANGRSEEVTSWTINQSTAIPGIYSAFVMYEEVSTSITVEVLSLSSITCPYCGLIYNASDTPKGCPVCAYEITGIEAYFVSGSNMVQFASFPNIAVVLSFRDTHLELRTQGFSIEDFDAYKLGIQTMKVTYEGFVTSLEVEVVDTLSSLICPKGHVYYCNEDGSDPGCPYCSMVGNFGTIYYFDITYTNEIIETLYAEGIYYFDKYNYLTIKVSKRDLSLSTKTQKLFFKTAMLGRKKSYIHGGEIGGELK